MGQMMSAAYVATEARPLQAFHFCLFNLSATVEHQPQRTVVANVTSPPMAEMTPNVPQNQPISMKNSGRLDCSARSGANSAESDAITADGTEEHETHSTPGAIAKNRRPPETRK